MAANRSCYGFKVCGIDVNIGAQLCGARISRGNKELGLLCALGKLPTKGMLSTATAKDKNVHLKVLAKIGKGEGLRLVFVARIKGTINMLNHIQIHHKEMATRTA